MQLGPRRDAAGGGRRRRQPAPRTRAALAAASSRPPGGGAQTRIPLPAIAPLTPAGKDSTQDFEEIGHSNSARKQLDQFLIGGFEGGDSAPVTAAPARAATKKAAGPTGLSRVFRLLMPLLLILAAIYLNKAGAKK